MKIDYIHTFDLKTVDEFRAIQKHLLDKVRLRNNFLFENINLVAGVDISYWEKDNTLHGACSIVVVNFKTKKIEKKISCFGIVKTPYIPGCLAFRELPLFIDTVKKLSYEPDIFIFDGNGYHHENHMGIATHASFFINKPTIGVAKSYYKIGDTEYTMPDEKFLSHTDIVINREVFGRVLRSKTNVKPIFVSCGNFIDLETSTKIISNLLTNESRIPIPTRLADIETHILRKEINNIF